MKIKLKNGAEFESMEALEDERNEHCCGTCIHYRLTFNQNPCSDCDEGMEVDYKIKEMIEMCEWCLHYKTSMCNK